MEPRKSSVDLGKELTCSICTELLYQPLTLLDCLHTYCGACLKEWFRFQAAKAARAPTPPTPDTVIFTCPSCRSRVRDTRHNATVVTLLDMYTAANPGRGRSDADKEEAAAKYKPGDQVLPRVNVRERTAEERRADEEDQRLMEEVRQMSLREAVAGHAHSSRSRHVSRPRHGGDSSRSGDERQRSSRDNSNRSESSHYRTREREREREESSHQRAAAATAENDSRGRDRLTTDGHRRLPSSSHSRQVEHQSSLRSLIGSQMSDRDIEREIEDFARQIQEEGLLDGLDLDNIDLSRDDELSRRITDAYRRRQRERPRHDPSRRSNASSRSNHAPRPTDSGQDPRLRLSSRPQSRPRAHSRSTSVVEGAEGRSRPPLSTSAHLEVRHSEGRSRRRTTSDGRSSTAPVPSTTTDTSIRPAAQSQTDLTLRIEASNPNPTSTVSGHIRPGRSSSLDAVPGLTTQAVELPAITSTRSNNSSFANRVPQAIAPPTVNANANASASANVNAISTSSAVATRPPINRPSRSIRPPDLVLGNSNNLTPNPHPSPTSRGHQQSRPQLYEEPSIACARCEKPHIEYEVHYNCKMCNDGQWNVCQDCYRAGKGCLHWFGFGQSAWKKWEKRRQGDASSFGPHMFTAARYLRPPSTSTNHETGKSMVSDDPKSRLQTGAFCAKCHVWTNECYWRCDVCNEGEWGFCNDCVNQGKSCSHKLLPLAHEATTTSTTQGPSRSPRSPGRPSTASMLSGPQTVGIGPFKPLTFNTRCDICQDAIPPSKARFHCFRCTSALIADASLGDYDICTPCYTKLEVQGRISKENGQLGWRRCLNGHRMVIVGFIDGKVGQWRYIERDLIGGIALRSEPVESSSEYSGVIKWTWHQESEKVERLVTEDVSKSAPSSTLGSTTYHSQNFPPDGGSGRWARAMWAWYPKVGADDELLFPRGADIKEIRDINGDWFFGSYMGEKGLFPAPYVQGYLAS